MSNDDSQTDLFHSIVVAPQMSLTRTCRLALLAFDARDERAHLVGHEVVDLDRDAAAAGVVDELGGLFDRLGPVHLRSLGAASCAR